MKVYLLNLKVNGIKSIEKEVELSFYNMKENNSQVLGFQEFRFIEVQNINNRTIS